jgi:tRNA 2-selenouridine synthase
MALSRINIVNFLGMSDEVPILDVRSPSEFAHAHIPGAHSMPLFNDDERKEIGTAYKQVSRESAIRIGLKAFGPKLLPLVDEAEKICASKSTREVRVHCWRGGMRSGAVAWLLDLYGFKVYTLAGGYKSYRQHVLQVLAGDYNIRILGGCTGANKTGLLSEMQKLGQKVIDLEGIAGHMGSAFGNLDLIPQPSQEHFENLFAQQLEKLNTVKPTEPIWVEAESQRIGLINIPQLFFEKMREAPMIFMDIPFEERLEHIIKGYGSYKKEKLINAILRIKKRLGGLDTKIAVNALIEDDIRACFGLLLKYYDKQYLKTVKSPEQEHRIVEYIQSSTTDPKTNAKKVLEHVITS